jgi:hypothetical protein
MLSAETWTAIGTVAMAATTFVVVLQGWRNRRDDERRHKDRFRPICVLTPYAGVDPRPWRNELLAVDTDASRPGFGIIEVRCALRNIGPGPALNVRIAFRLYTFGGYETEHCELGPLRAGEARGGTSEPLRVAIQFRAPLQDQEFVQIPSGSWEIIISYEDVFEQRFNSEASQSDESSAPRAGQRQIRSSAAAVRDLGQRKATAILRCGAARGLCQRTQRRHLAVLHRNSAPNVGLLFEALALLRIS